MKLGRHNNIVLAWMLAFAVLVTNVAIGSLHFCSDGTELPVTLHSLSDGVLHNVENGQGHSDRDVEPAKPALVKLLWHGVDQPLLAAGAFVLTIHSLLAFARNGYALPVAQSVGAFVHPNPRAPPL